MNIASFEIPPCPKVIGELSLELAKDEPGQQAVTRIIEGDVAATLAILKAANSPLLGACRRVSNTGQAIMVLGLTRVRNIVTAIKLSEIAGQHPLTKMLFKHAQQIANIAFERRT